MPIIERIFLQPEGELGLWRISEGEEWFLERLHLSEPESGQLDRIKGRRRVEWLAVRQLVHEMSGRSVRGAFLKDEYGKPHLPSSDWQISISHSGDLAAAIAAPDPVGIDIQRLVGKIGRLAPKFLSPKELADLNSPHQLEKTHVYWGAKESLYKAYGRRALDFCSHLRLASFTYRPEGGQTTGWVEKGSYRQEFHIRYRMTREEYLLVWAVLSGTGHSI